MDFNILQKFHRSITEPIFEQALSEFAFQGTHSLQWTHTHSTPYASLIGAFLHKSIKAKEFFLMF